MALGHRSDDGEPEAAAALGTCGIGAGEAFEGMGQKGGGEAWATVLYAQLDKLAVSGGAEADRPAAMSQRVVEHVVERLPKSRGIAVNGKPGGRVDQDLDVLACTAGPGGDEQTHARERER